MSTIVSIVGVLFDEVVVRDSFEYCESISDGVIWPRCNPSVLLFIDVRGVEESKESPNDFDAFIIKNTTVNSPRTAKTIITQKLKIFFLSS